MTLPWDELAEQFVGRPVIELPIHQRLQGAILDALKTPAPLLSIAGGNGVGKTTGVWWVVRALQRVNPAWTWLCLRADEEMTPDRCCDALEDATHLTAKGWYRDTPGERFARVQQARQVICLMLDEADLLPPPTLHWLTRLPRTGHLMIGLVSTQALTASSLPSFVFSSLTGTDLACDIGPQLSREGWFIGRCAPQYWPVCWQVARVSGGSFRRLWQLLFYARWLADRTLTAPLEAEHLQEAMTARKTWGWRTCLPEVR